MAIERRTTRSGWSLRLDPARAARARADGWWTTDTCGDALRRAARQDPSRTLLVDGATRVNAADLLGDAECVARALLARFAPGSVISFMLPNWHEAAVIYLGSALAGMVSHPVLPSLRDHELKYMLSDAGSRLMFIPETFRGHDYRAMLARVSAGMKAPPEAVVVRSGPGRPHSYARLLGEEHDLLLPVVDPDDVRMLMYTSGTTGRPKGVLHTHNSIGALIREIGAHWLVEPGDRFLVPSPVSHIGGSIYAFEMPVLLGTTAVLMDQWSPGDAVTLIDHEECTHMAGATPFLQSLLDAARAASTGLPSLKLFVCGGASVPPALIRDAHDHFSRAVVTRVYGSTEVPVATVGVIDRDDIAHAATTDGRRGIADIRIAADGEIRLAGPQMLCGYLDADDEADAFDEQGFFRSGDQGHLADGEFLVVTGRIKDLIIRNGENVAPKEIEDLLQQHPAVADVAIVGIPDPKTGERAVAVVVAKDGAAPDVAQFGEYLAALRVARFKHPEAVILWKSLPRNDAGKILKSVIRERIARLS